MLDDIDCSVTLETELEHVKAYLMLEEARFEEHLKIRIEAEPEDLTCRVPNLILQPIVENAVRHGAMKRDKGQVTIRIKKEEKSTMIDQIYQFTSCRAFVIYYRNPHLSSLSGLE